MSISDVKTQLKNFYRSNHNLPSIREFCALLGKAETYRTQAKRILDNLVSDSFLTQNDKGKYLPGSNFFAYELHHGVRAGKFTAASELMDYINLEEYLVRKPNNTIIITVSGDSMQGAGIDDGDLVIVETGVTYKQGDIIVAELNGEYTVKYYRVDKDRQSYLEPANPKYSNIYFNAEDQIRVVGVVTRAIKSFRHV